MNPKQKETYVKELNDTYEALRAQHQERVVQIIPLDEAQQQRLNLFDGKE